MTTVPGDALIAEIGALFDKIRFAEFPRLSVETVEDGFILHCPRCGADVDPDDLYAVDFSERWNHADHVDDTGIVMFDGGEDDYGTTVYYRHDDHAVWLPEGWAEDWT